MKILLTGSTGYIGKRLLPELLDAGHHVVCCVRDKNRFEFDSNEGQSMTVIEADFLKPETLEVIPQDLDAAYYLIHSMSATTGDFEKMEAEAARNFVDALQSTHVKQVIYLSGMVNDDELSKHLSSRQKVEEILTSSTFHLTTLRASIIVGSGSASFEIIRDLVEKLPVMIAPKWLHTKTQPIGIRNVLAFLKGVLMDEETFDQSYDIAGPEVLTYKSMLLQFAEARNLKRRIWTVPIMTPKLSSYWLYFVTSTSYKLAQNLVNSMSVEMIGRPNNLAEKLNIELIPYRQAVEMAFQKIRLDNVPSSWTDAQSSGILSEGIEQVIDVPDFGCFKDIQKRVARNPQETLDRIWRIGGETGWYYANWLWKTRGYLDKLIGGVGLRRGRKNRDQITAGDSLDFWRVLYADRDAQRLLLFAEMKLPGEAWLEYQLRDNVLHQTATFRPLGVWGRLYWYAVLPFHGFIFKGMIRKLTE